MWDNLTPFSLLKSNLSLNSWKVVASSAFNSSQLSIIVTNNQAKCSAVARQVWWIVLKWFWPKWLFKLALKIYWIFSQTKCNLTWIEKCWICRILMEPINPLYGHIHIYSNNIRDGYYGYNNENGSPVIPFTDCLGTWLIQPQLVHLTTSKS